MSHPKFYRICTAVSFTIDQFERQRPSGHLNIVKSNRAQNVFPGPAAFCLLRLHILFFHALLGPELEASGDSIEFAMRYQTTRAREACAGSTARAELTRFLAIQRCHKDAWDDVALDSITTESCKPRLGGLPKTLKDVTEDLVVYPLSKTRKLIHPIPRSCARAAFWVLDLKVISEKR
jgi:hypothetical protein